MADFKTYNVVYNINAVADGAETTLNNLAAAAEKLGNGNHMKKFNSQIKTLTQYAERMNSVMKSFSPRVDMRTFQAQLRLMEHAVEISAGNMRNMIQAALSGSKKEFERAIRGRDSWTNTMRETMLKEEKSLQKQLSNVQKSIPIVQKDIDKIERDIQKQNVRSANAQNSTSDKTLNALKKRLNVLKSQKESLTSSISDISDKLTVLGRTAPNAIKTSVNVAGNMAENAKILDQMSKAISKYNKVTANMPKSQTYKITFNAKDNTGAAIEKIRAKIAQLKAEAATIFFGGAPTGTQATKRTPNKRPSNIPSANELKNNKALIDQLKQLAYAKSNGTWSKQMSEQASVLGSVAAKALGLPADTPIEKLIRPLNQKYTQDKQNYDNWRASNAKPKTTATPKKASAPVRTTVPLGIQSPSMWAGRIYQIPTTPINYGSAFNGGNVAFGASMTGHRVQELVNGRPILYRGAFNGGDVAFGANQTLYRTQGLVDERPIQVRGRFNQAGIRFGAGRTVVGLNQLADQHRVKVKGTFDQSGLRFSFGRALVELQNIANARPINIKGNFVGGTIPTSGAGAARTSSTPKPGVYPSGNGGSTPPPSMPGVVPSGTRRNPVNVRNIYDGGVFNATKRALYPFTGNTSFGARTPAVVEMAKGMGMMMAVGGAMGAVGNSFSQSVDYQNMMTTTRAILGRSYNGYNFEDDISDMERIVRREGVLTKFTAPEVAGAAKYLAMAGMDIPTINAAIKPVTNIALAGDIDLPTAADKMTNIMTAFQMRTPRDFIRASDVLTNTFTKSNTNMLQLAEAAQYAAPIAAARGMKLEDMMALVGVMSDAGIQSSMAGTTLRMMMNNIYKPSKTQQATWDKLAKLGVTRTDRNGNWLNVIDILDQISQKVPVNGKAGESLADIMGNLFRVTSAAGATQLAKNITKVKALRDSNYNSYGAAESIRDARINNVRGKWAQVSSQFTENMLKIFEKPENQQKIMDMLDKFRRILAEPKTIKSLEAVFDVMLSMASFMGDIAKWGARFVGSMPNLIKAMLAFQFTMTMIGSYIITPIQQLINTVGGPLLRLAGYTGGARIARGASAAVASGLTGASLTRSVSRKAAASSATKLAAGRSALLGGVFAAAQARQIRYEQIANRLSYRMEQQYYDNPDERQKIYWMGNARLRAVDHAKKEAETVASLRNRMSPVTRADALSRYQRIYGHNYKGGYWGRTGAGMARGFNAGRALTAASLGLSLSPLANGLTNILTKLATGFGMLLSPVGLATMALGGLAGAGYALYKKFQNDKEVRESLNESERSYTRNIQRQQEKWDRVGREYINTKITGTEKMSSASKYNPQIQHMDGISSIYNIPFRSTQGSKILADRYNTFIRPYAKYMYGTDYGDQQFKDQFDYYSKNIGRSPEEVRKEFEKGAVYRIAQQSNAYISAKDKASKLLEDWSKLPSDQRDSSYKELMNNLYKIRDSFDYTKGIDISNKNFGTLRYRDILNSKQANMAIWNMLNYYINGYENDSARLFGKYNLENSQAYSKKWFEGLDSALGNISFADLNGATLQFKNGTANWNKFYEDLKKSHINFADTTENHLKILTGIAQYISNDPNLKGLESVRKYLEGLIDYIRNFDAGAVLNNFRNEMQIMAGPMSAPILKTTGEGNAPSSIRRPGRMKLNTNWFNDVEDNRKKIVNSMKYGVNQIPFKPIENSQSNNNNIKPLANNTVNIHIDSVMGTDRDSAQLFSDIVGKELVNAFGIINEQYQDNIS